MGPEPVVGQVTPNQGSLFRITRRRSDVDPLWSRLVTPSQQHQNGEVNVTNALSPVSISNGLVFNRQETLMYYIDTPTRRVDVFDYNLSKGTIGTARPRGFGIQISRAVDWAVSHVLCLCSQPKDGLRLRSE